MPFNPKRLEQARRRCGLSRRALAGATGISERTLSYNESGQHTPSDEHLKVLSRELGFPAEFFCLPDPDSLPKEAVSFRALSRMTARQRDRALAGGELALELNTWLEQHFMLPEPDLPDLRPPKDPESASAMLRAYWCLGDEPIPNMVHLLEKKGVRVFSLTEDCETLDAFSFWQASRPFIFLNTMKSGERSRFDAAHELGHLVLHSHGPPSGREAEREADEFASAFLMPRSSIEAHHPRLKSLPGLINAKQRWGASALALAKRMHDTGLLSEWHYRKICIDVQQEGMRKDEPNPIPRERSLVLHEIFKILWSEKTPPQKMAQELGWPQSELDALTFGRIHSEKHGATTTRMTLG